nr:MAG TPA: hypothetical protein [Bacteriophage sp.]
MHKLLKIDSFCTEKRWQLSDCQNKEISISYF